MYTKTIAAVFSNLQYSKTNSGYGEQHLNTGQVDAVENKIPDLVTCMKVTVNDRNYKPPEYSKKDLPCKRKV